MAVPNFEKGNTLIINTTFSDDTDTVVSPDNTEAFIEITDLDTRTVEVNTTQMTKISDTQYQFAWDTTQGLTNGEYEIEASAEISSNDVVNRNRIRLTDLIIQDGDEVKEFEKGNTVNLTTTFSDTSGSVVAPDNNEAFIEITDIDTGSTMVSNTTMTNLSDTQYQFNWSTTEGMNSGEYEVKVNAEISSNDVVNKDRIQLVDIIYSDKAGC